MAIATKTTPMSGIANMFRGNGNENRNGSSKKRLFAVGGLTLIIGVLMLGVSSLLPIHLIENMMDLKNSFNTVADRRTTRLISRVIGKENTDALNVWGKRNKLSAKQMARLNKGLEPEGLRFTPNAFE